MALLAVIGATLALNAAYDGIPEVLEHQATLHPQNSLIAEVQITLSGTAQVFIEYDNPEAGKFVTALSEPGTEHTIPVVRLRPETAYAYTIGVQDRHGWTAYGPAGEFTAGPLPPELAAMQIRAAGRSSRPLLVTDYKDGHNFWYFFWDETGSIVWYHLVQELSSRQGLRRNFSIRPKANGDLVYLHGGCCIVEITPLGEVVDWLAADRRGAAGLPHHDFLLLDDSRILYINAERAGTGTRSNGLAIWNPPAGAVERVWNTRSLPGLSLSEQSSTRLNSLSVGAGGRLLLSSQERHQIIALAPDFSRVEWRLGGPDSDYEFPHPGDRFYGPHTVSQLPNGHILLFDNGYGRPDSEGGAYSRALELRLDAAAGTAVKAWEYRHDPDFYAEFTSSAFRLSNGHTLVNFGVNGDTDKSLLPLIFVEVDGQGQEVFRVETFDSGAAWWDFPRRYRATDDITSIMGETMLRPPAAPPGMDGRPADGWWRQPVRDPSAFELRLDGQRLVYRKAPCAPGEIADSFFLHLYPANPGDLPEERREYGYEGRDFRFGQWGALRDGECLAEVPLPAYPIARLHTGQYVVASGERLWEVELPGPDAAAP